MVYSIREVLFHDLRTHEHQEAMMKKLLALAMFLSITGCASHLYYKDGQRDGRESNRHEERREKDRDRDERRYPDERRDQDSYRQENHYQ
jgi:Ni/Co efflux regulator RcnB